MGCPEDPSNPNFGRAQVRSYDGGKNEGRVSPASFFFAESAACQRRFEATKSQLTSAQNDSTYFGRALR